MKNLVKAACAALMATAAMPATATIINFDDGTDGALVGGFYSGLGVTFTNTEFVTNFGLVGSSGGLGIRAPGTFVFQQSNAVAGTLSSLASFVSIRGIDVGSDGLRIDAFDANNVLLGFDSVVGGGVGVGSFFDLSVTAAGIKSFQVYQITTGAGDGVLLEDFEFTAGGAVPEPASWAMLIAGFGLTGAAMRRRRTAIAA